MNISGFRNQMSSKCHQNLAPKYYFQQWCPVALDTWGLAQWLGIEHTASNKHWWSEWMKKRQREKGSEQRREEGREERERGIVQGLLSQRTCCMNRTVTRHIFTECCAGNLPFTPQIASPALSTPLWAPGGQALYRVPQQGALACRQLQSLRSMYRR